MEQISIIGLDIAKNVFQVHGIDASGEPVVRRQLKRRRVLAFFAQLSPCLVGMEACATSHHWAREIEKLGHKVQQSVLMLHRTRQLFVRQRTTLINAIRAHLAEFGIVAGIGRNGIEALLELIAKGEDERIPEAARECLMALAAQLHLVKRQILGADRRVLAWHRASKVSRRLEAIPGVGPLVATALVASIPDPTIFRSGRDMSAWIGLVD